MSHREYIITQSTEHRKRYGILSVFWIAEKFNLPLDEAQAIFNQVELTSIMTGMEEVK